MKRISLESQRNSNLRASLIEGGMEVSETDHDESDLGVNEAIGMRGEAD